jgi:signal recognition particle receptor subunit beta
MIAPVKVLVGGPDDGSAQAVLTAIAEVKIPSSVRDPNTARRVSMELGRVRVGDEFDLQIYGCDRGDMHIAHESVAPGVLGAVILVNAHDVLKPEEALTALDELAETELPAVVAAPEEFEAGLLSNELGIEPTQLFQYSSIDRNSVKQMLVRLIEIALDASP